MNLDEALFSLIHTVRNTMIQQLKSLDINLSPMHLKALKAVSKIDQCTGQKLADFMGRDKAQINRLIKELVNQDLVVKTSNEQDKRSQLLILASSGETLIKQFNRVEKDVFEAMSAELAGDKLEEFIEMTQKFKSNLDTTFKNKN
ncbi:MarR family winged helix-turn-helix transcriptional regulator [Marinomonas pollencensis]|uniref:DNA-binding MarR family transcriptional regulator n=1 Tax=Marinomonas pollencensis TaxID=491954 RepID=A0A3E0DMA0_9GAMM|nr:MarR family transcriptional regulator [Marinomonas pollencensis]REG82900.1 DNA-binding MarR family transcriptional regulator [Marinomonas pollencensis]